MLRHYGIKIFNRLPKRLTHAPVYFEAMRLIEKTRTAPTAPNTRQAIAERLAKLLAGALREVPYYRQLGLNPESIHADNVVEILAQFPYLTKERIMEKPEQFVSDRYSLHRLKIVTSGGSTGQGIKIYKNYIQMTAEWPFFDYEWKHRCGWSRRARTVRIGSDSIRRDDQFPCYFEADRLMVSPYHTNAKWLPQIVESIERFNPEYFHVFASCLLPVTEELKRQNKKMPDVKGVILASERIFPKMLDDIKSVFPNAVAVFHYGLTERSNLAWGSYEDGEISYRMDDAYGYSENFIHEDGRAEIVGTNLWNDVMPLIRYRTNDFAKIEDGWMRQLDGRGQEFLIARNGCRFQGFAIYIDESTWDQVRQFQIVQREIGKLEFHLVPRNGPLSDEFRNFLIRDQKNKWGDLFDISIVEVGEIPRTAAGKTRLVVSRLP